MRAGGRWVTFEEDRIEDRLLDRAGTSTSMKSEQLDTVQHQDVRAVGAMVGRQNKKIHDPSPCNQVGAEGRD